MTDIKLTEAQKKVLAVLTSEYQEVGAIMEKSGDCRADTRLLQLWDKDLVERDNRHRPGRRRTWLVYRLTPAGETTKSELLK